MRGEMQCLDGAVARSIRTLVSARRVRICSRRGRPGCWYVGAAFLREPLTEAHIGRVRSELAGDQAFALAEGGGPLDESGWHERKGVAEMAEVGFGVHPHQQEVVALRQDLVMDLLRALGGGEQID